MFYRKNVSILAYDSAAISYVTLETSSGTVCCVHISHQMSNVKNIYRQRRVSELESEALAAEEMLDRVVCSREQFSFQMCLESGNGSGTFCYSRQRVPDSWCRDAECLGFCVLFCTVL